MRRYFGADLCLWLLLVLRANRWARIRPKSHFSGMHAWPVLFVLFAFFVFFVCDLSAFLLSSSISLVVFSACVPLLPCKNANALAHVLLL